LFLQSKEDAQSQHQRGKELQGQGSQHLAPKAELYDQGKMRRCKWIVNGFTIAHNAHPHHIMAASTTVLHAPESRGFGTSNSAVSILVFKVFDPRSIAHSGVCVCLACELLDVGLFECDFLHLPKSQVSGKF